MEIEWDLNIFFREDYDVETEETTWDDVLSINPVIWTNDNGVTNNEYTDIVWTTTFAEARYLRSQYPEDEYGSDWTDSLEHFLTVAPPRLEALVRTLPSPEEFKLGGLRVLPTNGG
jgi:hypothetical protein